MARDPIIGIDFGTSNSVVAVCDEHGDPRVLSDASGNSIQPSVVSFHPSGSVMVGARAKQRRILDPGNTIYSAKRLLGRTFDAREVSAATERLPFAIKQGVNRQPVVVTRAGELSVPEVVAIILDHMRGVAQESLETEVSRAVVTVPANATDVQRTATVTAGQIAGLEIVQVINEPTAAALAYGHRRALDHLVAVYDFGGGTFDVTILQVKDDVYEVLATAGNTFLGGDDIDDRMADIMVAQFVAEHGMDLRGDQQAMQRLRAVAEQVKVELSRRKRAMIKIDAIAQDRGGKPLDFSVRLEREQLEAEAAPVVDRSFAVCQEALRMAGIDAPRVDAVILVGGTTKMPLVRRQVAAFFGQEPRVEVDPDEAVALGAALQAFALRGQLGPRMRRRNTARGAVVPPAPPMEARSSTMRGRDSDFARGSTMPWSAPWERDGDGEEEGNATDERTDTLDTMDVPTMDHGRMGAAAAAAAVAAGRRMPERGPVEYVSRGGRAPARARPAARPAGVDATVELGQDDLEEAGQATRGAAPAAPGGRTARGPGPAGRDPGAGAASPAAPGRGRSILQELDFASLGVEVHRSPGATGSIPLSLDDADQLARSATAALPSAKTRVEVAATPDASDSESGIPTEVRPPGPEPTPTPAPLGAAPRGGRPGAGAPLQGLAGRPEPQRTLQHPAGAPLPSGGPRRPRAPTIIEVTPHTLGVGTVAGYCRELLRRNARVPAEIQEVFTTSRDRQQTVRIRVCQGESRRIDENVILGDLVLDGIEPRPRGDTRIAVTFHIDESGILHVRARDENTGREQRADLELLGQPSQEEVSSASARFRLMRQQQGK